MSTARNTRRLPRSLRKHIRTEKARFRNTLPAEEAERAIERLVKRLRRAAGSTVETAAEKPEPA
jgi:hypothetical protein